MHTDRHTDRLGRAGHINLILREREEYTVYNHVHVCTVYVGV